MQCKKMFWKILQMSSLVPSKIYFFLPFISYTRSNFDKKKKHTDAVDDFVRKITTHFLLFYNLFNELSSVVGQ